jgi:hypothetical protein
MRIDRQRRLAETSLVVGFDEPRPNDTSLGPVPLVVRPLRLWRAPLVAPFKKRRQSAVREIAVREPRITRLWERFSVDVGVAIERDAALFEERIIGQLDRGYRIFILEDGDRYAIRAMCIFVVRGEIGYVVELLHDRSVAGMRGASHLLGLVVREMSEAGAASAHAWSLPHSGSFPIFVRHAFVPVPERLRANRRRMTVRAVDPEVEDTVTRRESWYVSYLDAELATDSAARR